MQEDAAALVERVDALLPQIQCRRCGYDSCRPYAHAMALGEAPINRCPPGGAETVAALARLLHVPARRIDPACGVPTPPAAARIDEARCIGCTLCVAACPVDAIVGAAKLMHTVLSTRCTGCELCLPPCPVDCIALVATGRPWTRGDAQRARSHFAAHLARLASAPASAAFQVSAAGTDMARAKRRAAIAAARARARARRAASAAART
jgi:electron transport complex protein RnfB